MVEKQCSTKWPEPDWAGLRAWLKHQEQIEERQQSQGTSVLCVGCRQWFIWPIEGLAIDPESGLPIYRCVGCDMARAAGFGNWNEFRLEFYRTSLRRGGSLREAVR